MKLNPRSLCRVLGLFILSLVLMTPQDAMAIKIKVKKPRVTVGKPKVHVPSPAQVIKNVGKASEDAIRDAGEAVAVAVNQTGRAVGKGVRDVGRENGRIPGHLVDAGDAMLVYLKSQKQSLLTQLEQDRRRLEEGKLLDLIYHAALAPLEATEEASFKATQRSSWVNAAATVAAGANGGPYGSAAYAAWQTYRLTDNNPEIALRAGLIAGLTSSAMSEVSQIDGTAGIDLARKTILAGSLSGVAVAASGGEEGDIQRAAVMGGAMVFLQDAYKNYVGNELDARGATKPPYCLTEGDPSCEELRNSYWFDEKTGEWKVDPSKLDKARAGVGVGTEVGTNAQPTYKPGPPYFSDRNPVMVGLARGAPAFNAMSFFHDRWVFDWKMSDWQNKATIVPAIALTYVATGAPLFTAIQQENAERAKEKTGTSSGGPQPPSSNNGGLVSPALREAARQTVLPKPGDNPSANSPTEQPSGKDTETNKEASLQVVVEALNRYQAHLTTDTALVVNGNPGTKMIVESVVAPLIDKVWVDPNNPNDFRTHDLEGIDADQSGWVRPEAGWEWNNATDPLSMEVRPIEGLTTTADGELEPAKGWDWASPDDPTSLTVIRINEDE